MGCIYRRRFKYCTVCRRQRAKGCLDQGHSIETRELETWWVKYHRDGRPFHESSRSDKETDARRLLRLREGDIERGLPVGPRIGRMRYEEAAADMRADYLANRKRSLHTFDHRLKPLKRHFGHMRMATVTTADVTRYVTKRQADGAANGTINRELTTLKRMFTLAVQGGKLAARPHIPLLREDNVRVGFFEDDEIRKVMAALPEPIKPVVRFAVVTGWRVPSEVLTLEWRQVNFEERLSPNQKVAGTVRLDSGTTKNGEGRVFPMTTELRAVLEDRKKAHEALGKSRAKLAPWVFHRDGERIKTFVKAWKTACDVAECPGRIPHDLRRTAVRNLVRAGIPERVAMRMTGHKTRSVFERYNIVSDGDLASAAARLDDVRVAG